MYYNWKEKINNQELEEVGNLIKNGKLVVFPTETVYGIGTNAYNDEAVKQIFVAKGRPSDNPLIVHISNKESIKEIAQNITEVEQKLIDEFMPGPFTIILKKTDKIPNTVSANLETVAVRMPDSEIAQKIIENAGVPIAAPSANVSGKPSGTIIDDIRKELEEKVSAIVDGGETKIGLESTVVKVINEIPYILRPGAITEEDIKKVAGKVEYSNGIFEKIDNNEKVESPGLKHKHYSPNTPSKMYYSENEEKLILEINKTVMEYNGEVVILGCLEHRAKINVEKNQYLSYGSKEDLNDIAKNIYKLLRKADTFEKKLIIIEGVKKEKIGIAIMNRLLRSCGFDYKEI